MSKTIKKLITLHQEDYDALRELVAIMGVNASAIIRMLIREERKRHG